MPAAPARIRKPYIEGQTEVLDHEIERCLLRGRGCLGPAVQLRTLDDWQRHWARWRGTIMPKAIEHRPGVRPFACYVVGEIPPRPVEIEPPLSHCMFKLYVPGRDGTGVWHCDYPEPYMRREVDYLRDLGIVSAAEHRHWRAWVKRGGCTYPYEMGLYE